LKHRTIYFCISSTRPINRAGLFFRVWFIYSTTKKSNPMTYKIPSECPGCGSCLPECPMDAISVRQGQFWIDPHLCNYCSGHYDQPQCIVSCPTALPIPAVARKGRTKIIDSRPSIGRDLFSISKKNHPFASSIVIWEACNLLAQGQSLPWQTNEEDKYTLLKNFNRDRGRIAFWMTAKTSQNPPKCLNEANARSAIADLDIRSACLHLIYAACATTVDKPWEREFTISDRQIEEYLGLDKRKDLNKGAKLALIKKLAQQPCSLVVSINWADRGKMKGFSVEKSHLWHLIDTQHHFQADESGCKHLVGLTFTIKAGIWAKYFLNRQQCSEGKAFYQYGSLPQSLLANVMSLWQQHEGAVRMMLWLSFKTRIGKEQRITIPTLMKIAYGEDKIARTFVDREERKRRLRTFEGDLEILDRYGLKPIFDPETYPPEIQPLWVKLADIPDDGDEAIEFWINDGINGNSLTDSSPRGKWNRLFDARLLGFELPSDWQRPKIEIEKEKRKSSQRKRKENQVSISGEQVIVARQERGWSQRELAARMGKSQSWIRDIENGRFRLKQEDRASLQELLKF
jgi:ferredoxin/DNA-binding transcriptional regulator YiaG